MAIIGDFIMLSGGENNLRLPALLVTTDTGATVTATLGTQTVTLTEIDSGRYYGQLTDYGTWTVTGVLNGNTSTTEVVVDEVKLYQTNVQFISTVLEDNSWEQISAVSVAGTGENYWSVGDTKTITLNGTVGTKSYSNVTLQVFILMFNMPVNKTEADNNIIWGGFKTTGGIDVCLDDDTYGNNAGTNGAKKFAINHWGSSSGNYNTNYGGWAACDLRYDILGAVSTAPSPYGSTKTTGATGSNATQAAITLPLSNTLMAALPSDFRNVLRLWTRWVDNKGNSSNVDANITAIVDAGISLLAEYEIFGTRTWANQYEQNHQVQCAYYAAGNSKVKYRQSSTESSAIWWESSARYINPTDFCIANPIGDAGFTVTYYAYGLAPAFKT